MKLEDLAERWEKQAEDEKRAEFSGSVNAAASYFVALALEACARELREFLSKARCKLEVTDEGLEIRDAFNGVGLQTRLGEFGVAMRDDGIELLHSGKQVWASVTITCPNCEGQCSVDPSGRDPSGACSVCGNRGFVFVDVLGKARELINDASSVIFDLQVRADLKSADERGDDWARRAQEFDILHGTPQNTNDDLNRDVCEGIAARAVSPEGQAKVEAAVAEAWDKAELALGREGHGAACYYCGRECSVLAGNPGEWPVALCHADDPGVVKWHHVSCVSERLHRLAVAEHMVHELQKDNTRLVEERRAAKRPIRQQVEEFQHAMDMPVLDKPQVPPEERVRLKMNLITEEYFEVMEAVFGAIPSEVRGDLMDQVNQALMTYPLAVNLPEFADALADLDYVVEGARLEFGIDGAPIAAEVHRCNMLKTTGPVRADGKRLKGPDWKPPDIAGELKKQGWEP